VPSAPHLGSAQSLHFVSVQNAHVPAMATKPQLTDLLTIAAHFVPGQNAHLGQAQNAGLHLTRTSLVQN
jgi:hypothetical protein